MDFKKLKRKGKNNSGFALVAAMMVLALLSVLGAAAIQSTTLEVKISARDRDAKEALYLAEATLDEYKFSAANGGWGEGAPVAGGKAILTTTEMPFSFIADHYDGFTLVDAAMVSHAIAYNSSGADPGILIQFTPGGPVPSAGKFWIVKNIPAITLPGPVSWDNVDRLEVIDETWFENTILDDWNGWTLWDSVGGKFSVIGSGTFVDPSKTPSDGVYLRLNSAPGPGPFILAFNPWLDFLVSGKSLPGDDDPSTPDQWDRDFSNHGRGSVSAVLVDSGSFAGTYELTSWGRIGQSKRGIMRRVYNPGAPPGLSALQRFSDWKVIVE